MTDGIYFIQTPLLHKQASRLQILMSAHWPEASTGRVIGFADRGPHCARLRWCLVTLGKPNYS